MRKVFPGAALIVFVLAILCTSAGKAQGAQVFLRPASSTIAPGESVTLEVWVQDVVNLYGADIALFFDPSLLAVEDAFPSDPEVQIAPGELFDPELTFEARNIVLNETGVISYTAVLQNPAPPVTGSGVLARITLRGLRAGVSAVSFRRVLLGDDHAQPIPAQSNGSTIAVGGPTLTPAPTYTATCTPLPSPTATGVPSPTPTPSSAELALRDAALALGWPAAVIRDPPLFKIQYQPSHEHTAEAWMRLYASAEAAQSALWQERDALLSSGWDVQTALFRGHSAYTANHSLNPGSDSLPMNQRVYVFQASLWLVGATTFDATAQALAPDPLAVAEAVYQAGMRYYLFGDVIPSSFLPIVRYGYPPMPTPTMTATFTPGPTATLSPTPTPTGSPFTTQTPSLTPPATATPGVTPTATASATLTATATPLRPSPTPAASPTPGGPYAQLIVNPSFETNEGWELLETRCPALYSVSRAHSGNRSMHLGIDTGANQASYSSVQQAVGIPAGVAQATLSFHYFPVTTQLDGDRFYFVIMRASDYAILRVVFATDMRQSWNLGSYDLREWAGQSIILRFSVKNDGLGGVTAVYLDDVEVWVASAE